MADALTHSARISFEEPEKGFLLFLLFHFFHIHGCRFNPNITKN